MGAESPTENPGRLSEGGGGGGEGLAFYFDASIPRAVAQALSLVRDDVLYPGHEGCPVEDPATKDIEWLPIAGANEWVVLMRDKRIRTRPGERDRLTESGVRAFVMTGAGNYSRWMTLELLVRRWREIDAVIAAESGPYIYSVTQGGLSTSVRYSSARETAPAVRPQADP